VAAHRPIDTQRPHDGYVQPKQCPAAQGTAEIDIFASLSIQQANALVKRACRWQDSDEMPGVMIAKVGDILTSKMLQKMIFKLAEHIPGACNKEARGIQLRILNATPISEQASAAQCAQKSEIKSWDEIAPRKQRLLIKSGVDHLREALHRLCELVGMFDVDLQPSSLDDVLSMVLQQAVVRSQDPLLLTYRSVPDCFVSKNKASALKDLEAWYQYRSGPISP